MGAGGDVEVAGEAVLVPLQRGLAALLSDLGELGGAGVVHTRVPGVVALVHLIFYHHVPTNDVLPGFMAFVPTNEPKAL